MNLALPLQPARKILALTAIAALSAMALLGGSGIMATLRPDPITPDLRPFDLDPAQWQATWGQILEHNVDEQGRINFAMNAAERARLQRVRSA